MKRWNGWGDDTHHHDMPAGADAFLHDRLGEPSRPHDAALADVMKQVPESRLPDHALVVTDAEDRLRHARGQSFPDWVALRSGTVGPFPDGVAYPQSGDDVRTILAYARDVGAVVIPYGGGTSVAGHVNPSPGDPPVLTLDLGRMNGLIDFKPDTRLATFGAGVRGPDLEAQLRARGFTLGHYPQSFDYSTLGGWIATRSSGQQSLHYGRIESLFAGGTVETPNDTLTLAPFPASAAGPDLREIVLGSEGRMGIITQATVRVSPIPERDEFTGVFFPDFGSGVDAVREIVQARIPLAMLRLSTATETETNLRLAGKPGLISALESMLAARGIKDEKSMLLLGYTGTNAVGKAALKAALAICHAHGGVSRGFGPTFGATWAKGRFKTPYLRNTLWGRGYGIDTMETATTWDQAPALLIKMEDALKEAMTAFDENLHVFTHFSHMYPTGTSIYTSVVFRLAESPEANLDRWQAFKDAISRTIVENGGTISHQHGVGSDHAPYLKTEKGAAGIAAIHALTQHFDPDGIMNPGKLIVG